MEPPPLPARRRRIVDANFLILSALAAAGAAGVVWTEGWGTALGIVLEDLGILAAVSPKVAAGVVIAVLLPLHLKPGLLDRWVGPERGLPGLLIAAAVGVAAPGGPSVVLPIAAGLIAAGADRGAIGAFLTGWVLLGANRTLVWEMSFLPPDLVWTRLAICLPAPLVVGLVLRGLGR